MQLQSYLDHPSHGFEEDPDRLVGAVRLTSHQLARLAHALSDDLEHLHQRLAHHEAVLELLVQDPSADATERHRMRQAAEQDLRSIEETNRAVASIDDGTYGTCTGCGRRIPFERLEALPTTQRCVACPET